MTKKIKRILLKISWETLAWDSESSLDSKMLEYVSSIVIKLQKKWIEVWVVVGWWNIFRWISWESAWIDRVSWDYMGMMATIINWVALNDSFLKNGIKSKLLTSTSIDCVGERFEKKKAIKYLEDNKILVFAWWTWNPYFSTDTAWVLRALEIDADIIIKATKVDWVYSSDPKKFSDAVKFDEITYDEVLLKKLKVMDSTAIALARDSKIKLWVVDLYDKNAIFDLINWKNRWTLVV